jgi:hypothetical protein
MSPKAPFEVAHQILRGTGMPPVQMKNPDKNYHDFKMIESILTKWKKEIIDEYFNRAAEEEEEEEEEGN